MKLNTQVVMGYYVVNCPRKCAAKAQRLAAQSRLEAEVLDDVSGTT
jgi:hypothetical protein